MSSRLRVAILSALFVSAVAGAATVPDISGVWLVEEPYVEARTVAGKSPPLRPDAAQIMAARKKAKQAGRGSGDPVEACLPHGVPRILSAPRPIQILQKPRQITVLYEANHQARFFYIDEPLPAPEQAPDVTYNGHSVARWDDDTLIVDTISVNDQTWLDEVGLPHSEALRVTERYQLIDPQRLRVRITITDSATFEAPWDMQLTFRRRVDLRLQEDPCAEKLWDPGTVK